jgi:hypothetical protein
MPWAEKISRVFLSKAWRDSYEKFLFRFRIDENNTAELSVEQSFIYYGLCKHKLFQGST